MTTGVQNIGIIIQARMGSTRLPSKIMLPVKSNPIFQIQINRLKSINYSLYIATTTKVEDDAIVNFAQNNNIDFFRGDENNVLSRYYECAKKYKLDIIIRLTSDCPLIDPQLIKNGLEQYLTMDNKNIYFSNTIDRTYPRGYDFEIFSFHLLKDAHAKALDGADKEHVTPYIWKNKNGFVHIKQIVRTINADQYRLTLDTEEDFTLLKILIEQYDADVLTGEEIIQLMGAHSELVLINKHIEQKK